MSDRRAPALQPAAAMRREVILIVRLVHACPPGPRRGGGAVLTQDSGPIRTVLFAHACPRGPRTCGDAVSHRIHVQSGPVLSLRNLVQHSPRDLVGQSDGHQALGSVLDLGSAADVLWLCSSRWRREPTPGCCCSSPGCVLALPCQGAASPSLIDLLLWPDPPGAHSL